MLEPWHKAACRCDVTLQEALNCDQTLNILPDTTYMTGFLVGTDFRSMIQKPLRIDHVDRDVRSPTHVRAL